MDAGDKMNVTLQCLRWGVALQVLQVVREELERKVQY